MKHEDIVIARLSAALEEAMIGWLINGEHGPPYRVPLHIDGEYWEWDWTSDREVAVQRIRMTIRAAVAAPR